MKNEDVIVIPLEQTKNPAAPGKKAHSGRLRGGETGHYLLSGKGWVIFGAVVVVIVFQLYFGIFGNRIHYFIALAGDRPVQSINGNVLLATTFQRAAEREWWHRWMQDTTMLLPVGAALALAGASFQALFRNPLASPDILGVTSGSTLGGVICFLTTAPVASATAETTQDIQALAQAYITPLRIGPLVFPVTRVHFVMFCTGLGTVALVIFLAGVIDRRHSQVALLLTGMAINASCNGLLLYIKATQNSSMNDDLRGSYINALVDGQLGNSGSMVMLFALIIFAPVLFLLSERLNAMSFGEESAKGMGIRTAALRVSVVVCSTFLTVSVVATEGPIAWVGMAAPFIARILTGPDNKRLFPVSMVIGSLIVSVTEQLRFTCSTHSIIRYLTGTSSITVVSVLLFFICLVWSGRRRTRVWD